MKIFFFRLEILEILCARGVFPECVGVLQWVWRTSKGVVNKDLCVWKRWRYSYRIEELLLTLKDKMKKVTLKAHSKREDKTKAFLEKEDNQTSEPFKADCVFTYKGLTSIRSQKLITRSTGYLYTWTTFAERYHRKMEAPQVIFRNSISRR